MDEIGRENAAGLHGQELLPRRTRTTRCGVDPGVMQDLPHRGGRDGVAELDEFALHPPVSPGRIVDGHADNELADRGCRGRPSGTPAGRVLPSACDQLSVPGEQRRRGYREHLAPSAPGDQPGQGREPQPVARLVADPPDLAAQDRVLMPEHEEFGILGHLAPGQHHQAAQQTAREQVGDGEDHSAMIPASEHCSGRARSSNRAHTQARRRQRLPGRVPGTGTMSPAATLLSFVAPKPLRRIARWPPRITATRRTPVTQSHQYRLPHTPLPWT